MIADNFIQSIGAMFCPWSAVISQKNVKAINVLPDTAAWKCHLLLILGELLWIDVLPVFPFGRCIYPMARDFGCTRKHIKGYHTQFVHFAGFIFYFICNQLPLNLQNFLNRIFHLPFLELSIVIFRDNNVRTGSWSADSIEPGQTAQMCMLTWLYTDGKG